MPEDEREGVRDNKRGGKKSENERNGGVFAAAGNAEHGTLGRRRGSEQVNLWRGKKKKKLFYLCCRRGEGDRRRSGGENSVQKDFRKGRGGSGA